MKNKLIVIGGSAGAKIAYSIARIRYKKIIFYDSFWDMASPIISEPHFKSALASGEFDYFVATGDDLLRQGITDNIKSAFGLKPCNIVHQSSIIESPAIGSGNLILAGAFIGYDANIGDGCIINTNSVCEHDSRVGNFSQIAPSATLLGRVSIGSRVFVGANATILPNLSICDDVVIGAGSTVVKNIASKGVYFGVPAKLRN